MTRPAPIEVGKTYRFSGTVVRVVARDEFNVRWRRTKRVGGDDGGDQTTALAFFEHHAVPSGTSRRSK